MAEKVISVYLAGAIRDGKLEDIQWREQVIDAMAGLPVRVLSPLGGKTFKDGEWRVSGVPSTARFITRHDKWYIENSDVVVFNFRALSQGYPNIGTLVEFGMAVATKKLIYAIVDPDYRGHTATMYKLHPFLEEFSSEVFDDVDSCVNFLKRHMNVMSGISPHYTGYTGASQW